MTVLGGRNERDPAQQREPMSVLGQKLPWLECLLVAQSGRSATLAECGLSEALLNT